MRRIVEWPGFHIAVFFSGHGQVLGPNLPWVPVKIDAQDCHIHRHTQYEPGKDLLCPCGLPQGIAGGDDIELKAMGLIIIIHSLD